MIRNIALSFMVLALFMVTTCFVAPAQAADIAVHLPIEPTQVVGIINAVGAVIPQTSVAHTIFTVVSALLNIFLAYFTGRAHEAAKK